MSMVRPRGEGEAFFKKPKEAVQRYPNGFPVGKRAKTRQAMNHRLDKLGIKECEIGLTGCWVIVKLSWAHALKSRFLNTVEEWLRAARACPQCHHTIEAMDHEGMASIVDAAMERRTPALKERLRTLIEDTKKHYA